MKRTADIEKRVVMVKRLAARWIRRSARAEYRFTVLAGAQDIKNLPSLLRSFRDGKVAMAPVPRIEDLGVKEAGDSLSVWSTDHEGIVALKDWFEARGFETSGVW